MRRICHAALDNDRQILTRSNRVSINFLNGGLTFHVSNFHTGPHLIAYLLISLTLKPLPSVLFQDNEKPRRGLGPPYVHVGSPPLDGAIANGPEQIYALRKSLRHPPSRCASAGPAAKARQYVVHLFMGEVAGIW